MINSLAQTPHGSLFAMDVCVEYPMLAADYQARFPRRMDLGTMRKNAQAGQYAAGKLHALFDDMNLMVNNCLTYNAGNAEIESRALTFQSKALEALDKHLRGTGEALAHLLLLLAEDEGAIFARDVCEEYPMLAEAYIAMCPERTDLAAMRKKATTSPGYKTLRHVMVDIDRMVANCKRFNGADTPLGQQADVFHAKAKSALEGYFSGMGGASAWLSISTPSHALSSAQSAALSASNRDGQSVSSTASAQAIRKRGRVEEIVASPPLLEPGVLLPLIRALERPQDQGIFSTDVVAAYPEIQQQYTRVCPHRMDLDRMKQKATSRQYRSLNQVRDDVTLIAKNCQAYNGPEHPFSELARSFQRDGEQLIAYYEQNGVLPPPPPQAQAQPAEAATELRGGEGGTVAAAQPPVLSSMTEPTPKRWVPPSVALMAHQIPLRVPTQLRERIATRHLHLRESGGHKPVGDTDHADAEQIILPPGHPCSVSAVIARYISALKLKEHQQLRASESLVNIAKDDSVEAGTTPMVKSERPQHEEDDEAPRGDEGSLKGSSALKEATRAMTMSIVSRQHTAKCSAFIRLLTKVFNDVFLHVLLYRDERCNVDAWIAAQQEPVHASAWAGVDGVGWRGFDWAARVHVEYFLRLLLHVPQLGAVAAALAAAGCSPPTGRAAPFRHAKEVPMDTATRTVVVEACVPLLEDFLCFVEAHWGALFEGEQQEGIGKRREDVSRLESPID